MILPSFADQSSQYAQRLFGTTETSGEEEPKDGDVEAEIEEELKEIRNPKSEPLFTSIKLDTPCGELVSLTVVVAYLIGIRSRFLSYAPACQSSVLCTHHLRRRPQRLIQASFPFGQEANADDTHWKGHRTRAT